MTESKLVNFWVDKEVYHNLKMLALRENRTVKEILNEEIENYIKVHKEGNPQHLLTKFLDNEDFVGFPAIATEYQKKRQYIAKNCVEDESLNIFGQELWGHVSQWYHLLEKL